MHTRCTTHGIPQLDHITSGFAGFQVQEIDLSILTGNDHFPKRLGILFGFVQIAHFPDFLAPFDNQRLSGPADPVECAACAFSAASVGLPKNIHTCQIAAHRAFSRILTEG